MSRASDTITLPQRSGFPPPARYTVPLLVLVFGFLTIWLNYRWNLADDLARGQADLLAQSDATGKRLTRLGGQLNSRGGIAALQADLAASASAPEMALAAFVDANGWVLASSSSELSGREARQTLLRAAASLMHRSTGSSTLYSEDASQLYAAYPVVNSDSWVLLVYDRSATIEKARSDAWRSLEWSSLMMAFVCLALWAVLHFGFAKRIGRLTDSVRSFGSGNRQPLVPVQGGDEVAELSRAFASMAKSVNDHELHRVEMERQVLEAGEKERRRIGHELHDGLGQRLTAAALSADALADKLDAQQETQAREVAKQIREAIAEARQLSHGLAPVGLQRDGLVSALNEMAHSIHTGDAVRVVFECAVPDLACPPETATHLFRIAQEAVNNALKHASPGEIRISLQRSANRLLLEIEDDGEGMPEPPPLPSQQHGMGLRVMRHRAQLMHGELSILPSPAGGTLLRCDIPFPAPT